MKKRLFNIFMLAGMFAVAFASCGGGDEESVDSGTTNPPANTDPTPNDTTSTGGNNGGNTGGNNGGNPGNNTDTISFYKGADMSWITEMEDKNYSFYDVDGNKGEAMSILTNMGMQALRLRVWVNPSDNYNNKADVLKKARRAKMLGLKVMIDFHYSDWWADPGKQIIPKQWQAYKTADEMANAVAEHTTDVLETLKMNGVDVAWVQVGNETPTGMLYDLDYSNTPVNKASAAVSGLVSNSGGAANFAKYVNAGYDAVKSVYPNAKVIVHVDRGDELGRFTWLFDKLKNAGGKWDVIGMSLYPKNDTYSTQIGNMLSNIISLRDKYNCEVVVSEIGMSWNASNAKAALTMLVRGARSINKCIGVFYWEPQCYNMSYSKGAFTKQGRPTEALQAFFAE